jgi:hypothetical protein
VRVIREEGDERRSNAGAAMRTMMRVDIPVESGNRGIADGTLPKVIGEVFGLIQPEAAYFTTNDGRRCAYVFFDLKDASDIPSIAEPFFTNLNAKVEFLPCMNQEDLAAGLTKLR